MGDTWRYNDADDEPPVRTGRRAPTRVGGQLERPAPGPIGRESVQFEPVPLATDLASLAIRSSTITYYFRNRLHRRARSQEDAFVSLEDTNTRSMTARCSTSTAIEVGTVQHARRGQSVPRHLASPSVSNATLQHDGGLRPPPWSPGRTGSPSRYTRVRRAAATWFSGPRLSAWLSPSALHSPSASPTTSGSRSPTGGRRRSTSAVGSSATGSASSSRPGTTVGSGRARLLSPVIRQLNSLPTYPGARLLGEFSGGLSRSGGRTHRIA